MIDLHMHSTVSDGTLSPKDLVWALVQEDITVFSLTDHDSIEGIPEAIDAAEKLGIRCIPGVEVAAQFNPEMHIIGYFDHSDYHKFQPVLDEYIQLRALRNQRILKKFEQAGIPLTESVLESQALHSSVLSRLHFAKSLVELGLSKNVEEAFENYLSHGRPFYVERMAPSPESVIQAIVGCGGAPVLAHPMLLRIDQDALTTLIIQRLLPAGLRGVEVYYPLHTANDVTFLNQICVETGLVATGGSDFHGSNKPNAKLGNLGHPADLTGALSILFEPW